MLGFSSEQPVALALIAAASGTSAQVSSQTLNQANNGHHIAKVKQVVTPKSPSLEGGGAVGRPPHVCPQPFSYNFKGNQT